MAPRALIPAAFLGGGVFLASFSAYKLWWLYLTYGVIGGIGLGMGYVVPVAVLVKWFPDRRGLITGVAVGVAIWAYVSAEELGPVRLLRFSAFEYQELPWLRLFAILLSVAAVPLLRWRASAPRNT